MASHGRARFVNDSGVDEIVIGVKEFECLGASAPHDHPHIYLDMGRGAQIGCPYCGTRFRYDAALGATQAHPQDCIAAE
ncbi:MAG: zinc-finger domain-containing protein [Alphaproteobacteria bacterium]